MKHRRKNEITVTRAELLAFIRARQLAGRAPTGPGETFVPDEATVIVLWGDDAAVVTEQNPIVVQWEQTREL